MSRKINLNQELVRKGYWYLPSSSEKKVAGILTYSPSDKITLELIGAFDNSGNKYFNPQTGTKVKASTFSIPGFCLISPEAEHWDKRVYA